MIEKGQFQIDGSAMVLRGHRDVADRSHIVDNEATSRYLRSLEKL